MIIGTAYGIALNDRASLERRSEGFSEKPYGAPPEAPVLYIKPRNTFACDGGVVVVPADLEEVEIAPTLAMKFGSIPNVPESAALVVDICEPHDSVYRPAIRERCRDGFLPVGRFRDWSEDCSALEVRTFLDDRLCHGWSLSRLNRMPSDLARELAGFMTLADGDVLLSGLPDDAPRARAGQRVRVEADGFAPLEFTLVAEAAE